jgi:hypothetical protein
MTDKANQSRRLRVLPPPLIPRPHPFFQSLQFANGNPAKSMKTSHEKKFNRYKNRFPGFRISPDTSHQPLQTPRDTNHVFFQAKKKLIATRPHSKIAATISEQRRRHFLTATKQPLPVCLFFAPPTIRARIERLQLGAWVLRIASAAGGAASNAYASQMYSSLR